MHQTKALGPLLLALSACSSEQPLEPREVESWNVTFQGVSHRLSALESSGRNTPAVTAVDNEPDLKEQLIGMKTDLLALASTTGDILKHHEGSGQVANSQAEIAVHLAKGLADKVSKFREFLETEKYPDEIKDTTIYICPTGLPSVEPVYGKNNTRAEEIAFKVADANE
ncbi:MAG: hypothetical protein KDD70_16990, partial [Bdellovibrionales bacterium]|nr:hypothetical protein [Bdellovibrionales bacterium]